MSSNKKLLQGASGFLNLSGSLNVEDVFSTHTYTGTDANGNQQVNGIDLLGEGGLVWIKGRDYTGNHRWVDTARGDRKLLTSNNNAGELTDQGATYGLNFNNDGFTVRQEYNGDMNANKEYVSWSFRKAKNFFDIQTWTGDGNAGRTISHNLGTSPGMIIIKKTDGAASWMVWHRSLSNTTTKALYLDVTNAETTNTNYWNSTAPTSTTLTLGSHFNLNYSGATYVGYFFAHDTSDEGLIQCGNFTGTGSQITTTLGFEPQWLMYKRTDSSAGGGWGIVDSLRGWIDDGNSSNFQYITANATDAEAESSGPGLISTGFTSNFSNGREYIYMAIRKGPMQTPTSRANVFDVELGGSSVADNGLTMNTGFPVDLLMFRDNYSSGGTNAIKDRLRGTWVSNNKVLATELTNNEQSASTYQSFDSNEGIINRAGGSAGNLSGGIYYAWRRAPKFFDIVAYRGNSTAGRTINHNLGVVPDMIWFKLRDSSEAAIAYTREFTATSLHFPSATATNDTSLYLNATTAETEGAIMNDTGPTSTVFSVSDDPAVNFLNADYIAYLFATLAGISKIGTFSHTNGSSTDVDCGFSSGSSFVIVKRTDATGDWYNWDSVRGIVSGNDPYLLLNTNAAQNSSNDYIDPLNSGFQMASGFTTGTYFFYAIAA